MFRLVGFYESQDGGGAIHNVAAIQDPSINTQGDDVRVPRDTPNIIGKACLSAATGALTSANLDSPSLRRVVSPDIEPLVNALVFGSPPESIMHPMNPTPVMGDESLNFQINSDHASAIGEYGLVWFSDGPQQPVSGQIYTVRATTAITLSAGTWVNGSLTFTQTLPVSEYEIVGMRARGTNLVAARLVFTDQSHRPGVPAVNAIGDRDLSVFRYGRLGSFGRFHSTTPPTVDALGVTDSAQTLLLDLVKLN